MVSPIHSVDHPCVPISSTEWLSVEGRDEINEKPRASAEGGPSRSAGWAGIESGATSRELTKTRSCHSSTDER